MNKLKNALVQSFKILRGSFLMLLTLGPTGLILSAVVMLGWNYSIAEIFSVSKIGFRQAFCLFIIFAIFGSTISLGAKGDCKD